MFRGLPFEQKPWRSCHLAEMQRLRPSYVFPIVILEPALEPVRASCPTKTARSVWSGKPVLPTSPPLTARIPPADALYGVVTFEDEYPWDAGAVARVGRLLPCPAFLMQCVAIATPHASKVGPSKLSLVALGLIQKAPSRGKRQPV